MLRTLLIEDEPGVADVLQVNLLAAGHEVTIVGDGQEAFALLTDHPPDLVILDLNLPRVSRFRFIEIMRRTSGWERVPVIVVTAYNFEEAVDVVRAGVDDFAIKPFDVSDVLTAVTRALQATGGGVPTQLRVKIGSTGVL